MMTEVGSAYFSPEEAQRLREYLLKGGFLWADDFWGSYAWDNWASEFSKVLPPAEYPMRDLPRDHPLFRTQFTVERVPQIPSINHWYGTGGTSERGADSAVPHARGVTDSKGRLLVLVTLNTDIGDSWEREGDDKQYFYTFSVERLRVRHQRAAVRDDALNPRVRGPRVRGFRAGARSARRCLPRAIQATANLLSHRLLPLLRHRRGLEELQRPHERLARLDGLAGVGRRDAQLIGCTS